MSISDTYSAPRDTAHRVLLIEDDPGDTLLFQDALVGVDLDLAIDTAASIDQGAIELHHDTDCIVLDLGLPGSTGLEALTTVRKRFPDLAVVVLTGWGDEQMGTAAVGAGAQDYLIKGEANGATIARSIRFAIERKRNERSAAMLFHAEMQNLEQARLERALLATPALRRTDLRWSSRYTAARRGTVSGDFLDGVELPDGTFRAIVGDVAGHGPDEAALGVSLRAGWRALVLSDLERDCVLAGLEDLLVSERSTADAYATVCDITILPDLGTIEVRSAGHPFPILAGSGPLVDTSVTSPLGMRFGKRHWPGTAFDLPARWSVALYTDGLFEIRAANGSILSIDDVPGAVEDSVHDDVIDPELLMSWFADRSTEGWRDDVAVAVISSDLTPRPRERPEPTP